MGAVTTRTALFRGQSGPKATVLPMELPTALYVSPSRVSCGSVPLECYCSSVRSAIASGEFSQVRGGAVPLVPLKPGLWNYTRERNGHNTPCLRCVRDKWAATALTELPPLIDSAVTCRHYSHYEAKAIVPQLRASHRQPRIHTDTRAVPGGGRRTISTRIHQREMPARPGSQDPGHRVLRHVHDLVRTGPNQGRAVTNRRPPGLGDRERRAVPLERQAVLPRHLADLTASEGARRTPLRRALPGGQR